MPFPFPPPVLCTVSKAAGAVPAVPLWDGPKWQHGEEHKEQLPGDALAHGQVQPERGGGRPEQSENRVSGCQQTGRNGKEMAKKTLRYYYTRKHEGGYQTGNQRGRGKNGMENVKADVFSVLSGKCVFIVYSWLCFTANKPEVKCSSKRIVYK